MSAAESRVVYPNRDLAAETDVVWLDDVEQYDYVRAYTVRTRSPTNRPPRCVGKLIGYAVWADGGPSIPHHTTPMYSRRVFTLKTHDRGRGGDTFTDRAPAEAVDPRTVAPGKPGELTERARGNL